MGQTFSNSTTATDSEQKAPGPHTDMSTPAPAPAAAAAASSSEQKEHDSYLDHIHGHQTTHIVLVTDGAVSDQPKASREFGSLCNTLFTRTSNFQADQNIYANLLVNKNNEPIALDIPHQPLQRLVLLLDTSGSMINEDRLTHLKSYIEHQFQQEAVPTHVTVITFSTAAHIVFNQRISPDVNPAEYIQSILEQIQNLRTSGCTNLHCAFEMLNTLITSEERSGLASLSIVGISTDSKIAPIGTVEKIKPFVREEYHPALQTMWSMAQNSFIDSSATRRRFVQQDIKRSAPSFVPMATLIPRASSLNRAVLGGPMGSLILSAELLQGSIHEEQSLYGWPLMQSESITSMKKHPALIKEFHSIEKDIKHTCKKIPDIQKNIQKTKASIDQSTMPAKDTDGVYAGLDEVIDYVHDVIRQDDLYLFLDINFCNRLVRESCEEPPIITRLINSDSAAFYNMNTLPSQLFPEEGNIWDVENADAPLSTNEWYTEDHVNTLKTRQLLFLCFNILSTEGDHFSMLNIVREMILNAKYPEETLPVDNQGYDVSPTTDEKKETSQSASATPQPIPLTDPFLLFCFLKKSRIR